VAILTEKSWKRHSNPWSVWTRILSYPLSYLPVWNRSWKQGVAVGAWFAANPVIFPPPEDDSSWATRCVLGEQLWTAKRRRDFPMALSATSAVFFSGALLAAYKRRFWPMMFFGGTSYLLKLWFLDRMTLYYEEHRERDEPPEGGDQSRNDAIILVTPKRPWGRDVSQPGREKRRVRSSGEAEVQPE
jgi:hypothetical protein